MTYKVIGAFMGTYRALGWGFLESVYHRAMAVEMQRAALRYSAEVLLPVHHRGVCVGEFRADFVVEDEVILELKVATQLDNVHRAQVYNYLKATTREKGLLLNFGPRPAFERLLLTNDRKLPKPFQL